MNIVSKKIHAAPSAFVSARAVLSAFAAGCALTSVLASSVAYAQAPPRREEPPQLQSQRFEQTPKVNDTRIRDQRDARSYGTRNEEQRRANEGVEVSRRNGRMTPDERRDLRRQINEVGQDIYANPPRR